MFNDELYKTIQALPEAKQKEVMDFVEFLLKKEKSKDKHKQPQKKRQFGYAKGFFEMKPDFDEPINDFKPYME